MVKNRITDFYTDDQLAKLAKPKPAPEPLAPPMRPSDEGLSLEEVLRPISSDPREAQRILDDHRQAETLRGLRETVKHTRRLVYLLAAALGVSAIGNWVQWERAEKAGEEIRMLDSGIGHVLRQNDELRLENRDLEVRNIQLEVGARVRAIDEHLHALRSAHDQIPLPKNANGIADDLHDGRRSGDLQNTIIDQ